MARKDPKKENSSSLAISSAFSVGECALALRPDLPFEQWEHIGDQLHGMTQNAQWWWGDWLNFGETRYGEKYKVAVEKYGLSLETAKKYSWVAREFEKGLRSHLSWSHHKELAGISDLEQRQQLITEAIEHKWSKARLRQEINAPPEHRGKTAADERFELSKLVAQLRTCCAEFSRKFRPDHVDLFAAILQDEAEAAREWPTNNSTNAPADGSGSSDAGGTN